MEYLPPEPKDVPPLMAELAAWISTETSLPGPIQAAVAAYQFVTIHPFEDGNGRTCRALATLTLKRTGYALKGMASMESFYAADVQRYYEALQMGMHHNYYESNSKGSRSDPDLTPWVTYFVEVFARAAKELRETVEQEARARVPLFGANPLEMLPVQIRQILGELADLNATFTPSEVAAWFGVSTKTARDWLSRWVKEGHFEPAKADVERVRSYRVMASLRTRLEEAGLA